MSEIQTSPSETKINVGAVRTICIDFGLRLKSGVTLSGTPTVTAVPTTGLALSSKAVNTSTFTDDDDSTTVAANEGVQVTLTPTRKGSYTLKAVCSLSVSGESEAVEHIVTVV